MTTRSSSYEWDNAEGAEISQIRDFMVDFRLNDEGHLELTKFEESCRDRFSKTFSRRQNDGPQSRAGVTKAPAQADPFA
jgi:hypothetical protein